MVRLPRLTRPPGEINCSLVGKLIACHSRVRLPTHSRITCYVLCAALPDERKTSVKFS